MLVAAAAAAPITEKCILILKHHDGMIERLPAARTEDNQNCTIWWQPKKEEKNRFLVGQKVGLTLWKKTLRRSQAWGLNLTSIFVSLSLTTEWDPLWRPRSVCAAYSPGRAQEFESAITGVACHRARTDGVACIELHCGVSRSTREAAIGRCCKQKREGKWGLNLKGFLFVDFQTRKKVSRS